MRRRKHSKLFGARSVRYLEEVKDMEIGDPKRVYTIEPIEEPIRRGKPDEEEWPALPVEEPATPEKVPAGV